MEFDTGRVPLQSIDSTDDFYLITTTYPINDLADSIKHVDLINPPLLLACDLKYRIVCGFQRIAACRHLGFQSVPAKILDPATAPMRCAELAISDNTQIRKLNLIEESRALRLLSRFIDNDKSLCRAGAVLGLNENLKTVEKIRRVCHMPLHIIRGILSGIIALPMALELERLDSSSGTAVCDLFINLKVNLNKQREIFTLLGEVAILEDIAIVDILREDPISEIIHAKEMDRNQKIGQLRMLLKKRRFPELSRVEERFGALSKALKLGDNVKLIPPANFEGTAYTLTLTLKNIAEAESHKQTLHNLFQNPIFREILG